MTVAEFLSLLTLVVLAGITWWYAKQTADIAKATNELAEATKRQADAGVAMAQEMVATRKAQFQPVLAFQTREEQDFIPWVPQEGRDNTTGRLIAYFVTGITNVGTGPALNVGIEFEHPAYQCQPARLSFLGVGQYVAVSLFLQDQSEFDETRSFDAATLVAKYEDVFTSKFETCAAYSRNKTGNRGDGLYNPQINYRKL